MSLDHRSNSARVRSAFFAIATIGASFALFLHGAGSMPLTDPDEGRYAEIAREMIESGDWVVPTLFGIPYLEKPPLLYWSTALAFEWLGAHELGARSTSAAAAALGVFLVGAFARRHVTIRAGWLSSLVLASSGLYFVLARTLVTDMLFSVAVAGCLLSFLSTREAPERGWRGAFFFWFFLAAATMTKGPVAIVIAGGVIFVDALFGGSSRAAIRTSFLATAPLFVALAVPWFWVVQATYPEFFSFYLWKEHLSRATGSEHAEPFYWFVPVLAGGLLPWTPLALAALPASVSNAREMSSEGRISRFLLIWASLVLVIFSAASGKLATYILPMFPPLAILLGRFLDRLIAGATQRTAAALAFLAIGTLFCLLPGVLPVAWWGLGLRFDRTLAIAIALSVLGGGGAAIVWRRSAGARALGAVALSTIALYAGLASLAPPIAQFFTARPHVRRLAHELAPGDDYAFWRGYFPSVAFYLRRYPLLGLRHELRFGKELAGEVAHVFDDLPSLAARTRGRRLFVLTSARKNRETELRQTVGDVEVVAGNYVATLWLRGIDVEPPLSSAQALTHGSNRYAGNASTNVNAK